MSQAQKHRANLALALFRPLDFLGRGWFAMRPSTVQGPRVVNVKFSQKSLTHSFLSTVPTKTTQADNARAPCVHWMDTSLLSTIDL